MIIRKASKTEFEKVRMFYHEVIDGFKGRQFSPGWKKDIYPAPDELRSAIAEGSLYIGEAGHEIVASMVVNNKCNEDYSQVHWENDLTPDEYLVIHMLGVHPNRIRQGLAREMVQFAINLAKIQGVKAIRLDVLAGNLPAEKLYTGFGFTFVDRVKMFYEDTGWTDYLLYEYMIEI